METKKPPLRGVADSLFTDRLIYAPGSPFRQTSLVAVNVRSVFPSLAVNTGLVGASCGCRLLRIVRSLGFVLVPFLLLGKDRFRLFERGGDRLPHSPSDTQPENSFQFAVGRIADCTRFIVPTLL